MLLMSAAASTLTMNSIHSANPKIQCRDRRELVMSELMLRALVLVLAREYLGCRGGAGY
jgi:hypothetical protein